MAKHILADVCDCKRAGEIFYVEPDSINVEPGWNDRTDFSGHEELVESIRSVGVLEPLLVKKIDGRLMLRKGERRLRAVNELISKGAEIRVPIIVKNSKVSDADLLFDDYISNNTGKPFTPSEEASRFKRLINYGFSVAEIASKTGKSQGHIRNRLDLANASPEVKAAVDTGEIPITQGQAIAKNGNLDEQSEELKKARAKPKRNKLILSIKNGSIKRTGIKDAPQCYALESVFSEAIMTAVADMGFKPDTIRVSVELGDAVVAHGKGQDNGFYDCIE